MRCPSLEELPPPPPGLRGWPWTEGSVPLPGQMADGSQWPRISIVTPNYNYARYLEAAIRSVLLQGYPNLEFIIHDDGSTDGSLALISKYKNYITHWSSEPNRGQVYALNKALSRTTGDLINWLNSDDLLLPGALFTVAQLFKLKASIDIISGARVFRSAQTQVEKIEIASDKWPLMALGFPYFPQETTFISRRLWEKTGVLDERLNYGFDTAFYAKALKLADMILLTHAPLGVMRMHPVQKTQRIDDSKLRELPIIGVEYFPGSGFFSRLIVRLHGTRFAIFADAILRCGMYYRAKSRFLLADYNWAEERWTLSPLVNPSGWYLYRKAPSRIWVKLSRASFLGQTLVGKTRELVRRMRLVVCGDLAARRWVMWRINVLWRQLHGDTTHPPRPDVP